MVELSRGTAIAIAAAGVGALLVLALALVRSRRRSVGASRRLAAIAARLDAPGAAGVDDRDEVGRLERLAEAAVLRLSDADARADRLGGALEVLPQGVVVCDEHGDVVHCNAAAAAAGPGDGLVGEAVHHVLQAVAHGDDGAAARTVEVLGPPRRTLRVRGHALDDGRRVVGAVAVVEDMSEQRRLEVTRRDFLTNVTAELKAPLGALGLLAGTIVAEDDAALTRRLASRLERDAVRVGRLVDDLAELSRLDAQALPHREPVPVHLLVAQAVEQARCAGPWGAVSIEASTAGPGLTVVGDRRELVSALRHLVENALQLSDAEGEVRVNVAAADGWAEIAVSDSGPGIAAGDLDRIFECFYRVERARARTSAGTGLGLAIASQVASGHGGQVLVSSEEGKGSTFTLRVPAQPEAKAAPTREAG